jgi:hypothetical protein
MRRCLLTISLIGSSFCMLGSVHGQEERAPMANAVGRFFGFGYSAGYHAQAESRYGFHRYTPTHNVVPQPPRGIYAAPMTPYGQPAYGAAYAQPIMAPAIPSQMGQPIPMSSAEFVPAPSAQPAKPVEPPPGWLKQFLKDQPPAIPESDNLLDEESPSDRRGVSIQSRPEPGSAGLSITAVVPPPPHAPTQIGRRPVVSILQH